MNLHVTLIGSNPLPAYIGVRYLLRKDREEKEKELVPVPDKIMFVYSKGTKEFYENLVNELNIPEDKIIKCNLEENYVSGRFIKEEIKKFFVDLQKNSEIKSITLNNTGGTKPMAVYSTECLKEFGNNNNIKTLEFYINPNTDKICINLSENDKSTEDKNIPVNLELPEIFNDMDINTILSLHGLNIKKNKIYEKKAVFDDYNKLKNFVKFVTLNYEDYSLLSDLIVFNKSFKDDKFFIKIEKLINEKIDNVNFKLLLGNPDKEKEALKEILNNFKSVFSEQKYILENININFDEFVETKKGSKILSEFLSGGWLEQYLYKTILELYGNKYKVYLSIEAYKDGRPCEIDVIAIKGYKMYLFSCTTDNDISTCKQKAFEALYRAEQLGGEHAKVILVNMLNEKILGDLKKDMKSFNSETNKGINYINKDQISDHKAFEASLIEILK